MAKELRWALALGILGAAAVGLLVANAERVGGWLNILTFLGVLFLVVNTFFQSKQVDGSKKPRTNPRVRR